jgi:hypothetical protein|tara:strand:+ start:1514 stop:1702 length:189 start_codon:yes stop_codon:yes gene_type:complete
MYTRQRYQTFEVMVRVPIGVGSSMTRVTPVRIEANDSHSARGMATAQYGARNIISNPMLVRR